MPGKWHNRVIVFLLIMALATYAAALFVDVTRDGSKYATIAREVFESGDFIHLKIHGEPYIQKPPLLFWLSALSFHIFGLSNFSFKLPLLLMSFAGLYSTFRLGKEIHNRETGLVAAALLGTSQISFLYNMDIHTDTLLQSFVSFSLWQLYSFLKNRKNYHFILGFCGIGLAMLTKGPVGAVVPAFAVAGYLLFTRQIKRMTDIRWYIGILIAGLIILPALIGLYNQFGREGILFYFWTNNIGRINGTVVSRDTNYLFYIHNLLYLFLPWMFLLFSSIYLEFRSLLLKQMKEQDWFVFSGIWFFFVILSVSHGKLPNYIFILMPLFSVLTAKYVIISMSGQIKHLTGFFLILQTIVAIVTGIVLLLLVFWLFPVRELWKIILLLAMAGSALWTFFHKSHTSCRLLLPSASLIVALNFFINQHVAPKIFSDQASVKAAKIFNQNAGPDEKLYNYNYFSHELFFYGKTPVVRLINDVGLFELMKKPGNWVLTTEEVVNRMPDTAFPVPEIIPLKHVWINDLSFEYLNPVTREESYDTLFLLRSAGDSQMKH